MPEKFRIFFDKNNIFRKNSNVSSQEGLTFIEDCRDDIIYFMQFKFFLKKEDAEDIFQDACLDMWNNLRNNKISERNASPRTYLNRICYNKCCKYLRDRKPTVSLDNIRPWFDEDKYDNSAIDSLISDEYNNNMSEDKKQSIDNLVKSLKSPCNDILWLYYYENMNLEYIAKHINYRNADSVKSKKTRCMDLFKSELYRLN